MKISLFLCICLLGVSLSLLGQGSLVSMTPNLVAPGYSGNVAITGSGTTFNVATAGINLRLTHVTNGQIYNFGSAPGGSPWAMTNNATSANGTVTLPGNAPPGMYNVQMFGFSGYNFMQNMSVTANSFFQVGGNVGYFDGQLVMDLDSNCSKNGADYGLGNRLITATPGPYYGTTDANGNFHMALPLGTYTFSASAPNGALWVCPAFPYTQNATQNTVYGTTSGINFFVKTDHAADVASSVQLANHRPGFSNNNAQVTVENATAVPANNVVVKFVKPSNFNWVNFYSASPTINGDTATFNVGTLAPYQSLTYLGRIHVPVGTPLGTPFTYKSIATTSSAENTTSNNNDTKSDIVTGGYDPNDKQVWTTNGANADGLVAPTDSLFRYLIRFQNTGNDTAFNIVVRDTFDTDFNMGSLSIVGYSHPMTLQIPDSTGRRIRFVFDNIELVDSSTNEPLSHGYVEYSIRKNNGLANGTVLSNRASIYFDFNVPVHTNAVNSTICPVLGTAFTFTTSNLVATLHGPTTGGATGWAWDFGDGQTGTGVNPVHTYTAGGTYNVCVTVSNACGRSTQICLPVTVTCAPFNAGFSNAVSGMSVSFTNVSTGPYTSLLWEFGDGNTSALTSPSHTYSQPGLYTVCLYVTNACSTVDTSCVSLAVGCVAPVSAFVALVNQNTVSFTDQSTNTPTGWAWDFGDGGTSTVANPTHTYAAVGNYTVCLTATNACGPSDSCSNVSISVVGVSGMSIGNTLLLPNPAQDHVQLRMVNAQLEDVEFKLCDALGRVVLRWGVDGIKGDYVRDVDLSGYAKGVYFLRIEAEGMMRTMRVMKN